MARLINRGLSLAVVITYLVAMLVMEPGPHVLLWLGHLLVLLAFIWYGDELGDLLMHWKVQITATTPGWLLATVAWGLLLLPAVIYLINR